MASATSTQRKIVKVLFDEYHSESWSVSRDRASQMTPDFPENSSYALAGEALITRDFIIDRNTQGPLDADTLNKIDVLVLLHPCDEKWERTTSKNSPLLKPDEILAIQQFVANGGGLLAITEYEHEKYGDNLNALLAPYNLKFENTTVMDAPHALHENPTWFPAVATNGQSENPLSHLVRSVSMYRSGSITATGPGPSINWHASDQALPKQAGLIASASNGKGRVVVVADSSLFGDKYFDKHDHAQLWLNIMYWCAAEKFKHTRIARRQSPAFLSPAWASLKGVINQLRELQNIDGSVPPPIHSQAKDMVTTAIGFIQQLESFFPHQTAYLKQVMADLTTWVYGGFLKPDFGKSLAAFRPELNRQHRIEHLVVFPMYTPNGSRDTRFEALLLRVPWPDWLAELERTTYQNAKFVPAHLIDHTEGYNSECAVLFPETISLTSNPTNNFSTILCDREAKRLQRYFWKCSELAKTPMHPQLECFFGSLKLVQDALALWDLIHDKSHSVGELPFDPFMIRQRSPFWMYALEELRVDLRSFVEATRLNREGFPFAQYVCYSILFDRIFRFPITGNRIRNYDAVGGQLLFSYLHQKDVIIWRDNIMSIRWDLLAEAVANLRNEVMVLYKGGADSSKISFWMDAHDLISKYVKPNVASKWKREVRQHLDLDETDPRKWIALVNDDEFPLGTFHANLQKRFIP